MPPPAGGLARHRCGPARRVQDVASRAPEAGAARLRQRLRVPCPHAREGGPINPPLLLPPRRSVSHVVPSEVQRMCRLAVCPWCVSRAVPLALHLRAFVASRSHPSANDEPLFSWACAHACALSLVSVTNAGSGTSFRSCMERGKKGDAGEVCMGMLVCSCACLYL